MRCRVKFANQTAKVEVPGSCTWGELRQTIAAQLFPANPSKALQELQLSFNNKDAIIGDDGADVKGLGVAAGDLLWVLSPKPPAPDPQPSAPEAKRAKEEVQLTALNGGRGSAVPGATSPSRSQPAQTGPAGPSGTQPVAAAAAAASPMEEDPVSEQEQGQGGAGPHAGEELPAAQAVPSYLLRTLAASAAATPAQVLLLAAHAAMLEAGFQPTWVAAEAEAEGAGVRRANSDGQGGPVSPYAVPASAQACATIFRLQYRLPALGAGSEGGAEPSGVVAGDGSGDGSSGSSGDGTVCTLQCSTMGRDAAVLVASTPRGHTHHLALTASSFLEEEGAGSGQGAVTSVGKAATEAGPSMRAIEPSAAGSSSGGQGVVVASGQWRLGGEGARRLWRALKDGLAFPMLLAAFAEAGLPAPAGLLALPEDLKLTVLGQLNALQLAALSATCAELRHLASQDALWRPLFETEFPSASQFYASQAHLRGFKWAFGACWRDRKQREEAARRQRRFMAAIPHLGPRPPFYPPPGPLGMPGITGGDYDRLPQPFLGGGPGMFPGGGGGLGNLMFGSGRRQGRGGGGGFRMF